MIFQLLVCYIVSICVCMGSHFSYGDVVSGGFFYFTYYVGYEEIIQVVILGG